MEQSKLIVENASNEALKKLNQNLLDELNEYSKKHKEQSPSYELLTYANKELHHEWEKTKKRNEELNREVASLTRQVSSAQKRHEKLLDYVLSLEALFISIRNQWLARKFGDL